MLDEDRRFLLVRHPSSEVGRGLFPEPFPSLARAVLSLLDKIPVCDILRGAHQPDHVIAGVLEMFGDREEGLLHEKSALQHDHEMIDADIGLMDLSVVFDRNVPAFGRNETPPVLLPFLLRDRLFLILSPDALEKRKHLVFLLFLMRQVYQILCLCARILGSSPPRPYRFYVLFH